MDGERQDRLDMMDGRGGLQGLPLLYKKAAPCLGQGAAECHTNVRPTSIDQKGEHLAMVRPSDGSTPDQGLSPKRVTPCHLAIPAPRSGSITRSGDDVGLDRLLDLAAVPAAMEGLTHRRPPRGRHRQRRRNTWTCLAERVLSGWPMTLRAALLLGLTGIACVAGLSLLLQLTHRRTARTHLA
jgi:hypothetical protein